MKKLYPVRAVTALMFLTLQLFIVQSNAQNASQPVSLTVKQAVEYALKNQKDVQNASLDVEIAKARSNELIGIGLPQINANADFNRFLEIPTQFVPGEFFGGQPGEYAPVQFGQEYTAAAGFYGSQLLFDGSYLVGLKASKVYTELSRKNLDQSKIDVAVNVMKAYYLVLVAEERFKQLTSDLARLAKLKDDTRALFDNGFVEKIDYDRIELNYNLVESSKNQIQRAAETSYLLLKFQMGMDLKTPVTLAENINDLNVDINLLEKETVDYNNRIEYSILKTQFELTGLDTKRYKSLRWPTLRLNGNYYANASRNEFNFFDPSYKWYPSSILGASIQMPIFNGFVIKHQVSQAKLANQKVANTILKVEQGIEMEFQQVLTALKNNLDKLSTQSKNRDLAREISRVSKIKYDQGVGSNLEVIDAENSLREAETNYYTALLEAILAKIDLEKAKGTIQY